MAQGWQRSTADCAVHKGGKDPLRTMLCTRVVKIYGGLCGTRVVKIYKRVVAIVVVEVVISVVVVVAAAAAKYRYVDIDMR